jgi:hypothetical protein
LQSPQRLADVIAAIQTMATYKFYNLILKNGLTEFLQIELKHLIGKTFLNSIQSFLGWTKIAQKHR